ncbi:MAG TPA: lysophospholipid acyltransferase family protein [Pseudonocardiaceae bacterium]
MAKQERGFWIWFAAAVLHPVCWLFARRVNRGVHNIPSEGGGLLVMNHVSHIDPIYDGVFVHRLHRLPHFLAKNTLWKGWFLSHVMDGCGQIPVYRSSAGAQDSLRDANQALRDGKIVVIYPEGTITRDPDGWPMKSRTGVARLALNNDIPVIPAARWGTLAMVDFYRKKFHLFPRGKVTTVVGEPIDLSAYRGRPITPGLLHEVTELIMHRVAELVGEIRGETPPPELYQWNRKADSMASDTATRPAASES